MSTRTKAIKTVTTVQSAILTGLFAASIYPADVSAQSADRGQIARAEVWIMRVAESISVEVYVNAANEQVVVPYCQKSEGGDLLALCYFSAHLEQKTKEGWRPVRLTHKEIVLGNLQARPMVVAPNRQGRFVFVFSKEIFAVEHGQQLRVTLDAWPDEQSMRSGERSFKLTGPSFACP